MKSIRLAWPEEALYWLRVMERGKEVGIRKSIGAERRNLIAQFLGESFIIVSLSMVVAILVVTLALPAMKSITGRVPLDRRSLGDAISRHRFDGLQIG